MRGCVGQWRKKDDGRSRRSLMARGLIVVLVLGLLLGAWPRAATAETCLLQFMQCLSVVYNSIFLPCLYSVQQECGDMTFVDLGEGGFWDFLEGIANWFGSAAWWACVISGYYQCEWARDLWETVCVLELSFCLVAGGAGN